MTISKKAEVNPQHQALVDEVVARLMSPQVRETAKQNVRGILGVGAGAGLTLAGLYNLAQLNRQQLVSKLPRQQAVQIELFDTQRKKRRKKKQDPDLFSYSTIPAFVPIGPGANKTSADNWQDWFNKSYDVVNKGEKATSPWHLPDHAPSMAAAGLLGFGGSYWLANKIFQAARNKAMKIQLQKAEKDYEDALYDAGTEEKVASERSHLGQQFDRIVAVLRKHGAITEVTNEKVESLDKLSAEDPLSAGTAQLSGRLAGYYLTAALLAAAYGAHSGFKNQRAGSKTKAIERAQLERLDASKRDQPIDVMAVVDNGPGGTDIV